MLEDFSMKKKVKHTSHFLLLTSHLLSWYSKHKRDLPWRKTNDPYCIWISEIMLQQTLVVTVIDYYHRFLKKFPDLKSLAMASEEEVLAQWSGLGYYSRARNLHKAAQKILKEYQGKFPEKPEEILSLPGIGRYTLGAIASIAFNQALPLVDGNVIRVYSRLFALKGSPSDTKFQKKIWGIAEEIISSLCKREARRDFKLENPPQSPFSKGGKPGDFNQALMELGATICSPQNPTCLICPVQNLCQTRSLNPENYPEKKKAAVVKKLVRYAAVLKSENQILLCLSSKHRWMKHLWQLPSLFIKNEQGSETLQKHLENIGIKTKLKPFKTLKHQITHHQIQLQSFIANTPQKTLKAYSEAKYEWHSLENLPQLAIPAADRKILEKLL